MDSLKSEHMPDWLRVTSGQLWSFKLVEYASNRLYTRSYYHSVLKDGSHDQSEQDVNDFLKKAQLATDGILAYTRQKIEVIGWSFHIEHITNLVTSVKKDTEQEYEATIL
jgi:hypothetical protein